MSTDHQPSGPLTRHPGFPARALLRPGVRVCRRSATELQVGLGDRVAVLVDDAGVRLLLSGLADGRPPGPIASLSHAVMAACDRLLEEELLVDADIWCNAIGGLDGDLAQARSALVAELGDDAGAALAGRSGLTIAVQGTALHSARDRLADLLTGSGLRVSATAAPDLVVHVCEGEPDRALLDDLVREERAHVVLAVVEGAIRVGPLVQPGVTACQRCMDADLAEGDPRRALVLEQYSGAQREPWGLPTPVPRDLMDLAVALLARDVARWADGIEPVTWSTSIAVDPGLTLPRRFWHRHAACGCSTNAASTASA